jgi:hypothetical protein
MVQRDGDGPHVVAGTEILAVLRGRRARRVPGAGGPLDEPALVARYAATRGPLLRLAAEFAVTSQRVREVLAAHGTDLEGIR